MKRKNSRTRTIWSFIFHSGVKRRSKKFQEKFDIDFDHFIKVSQRSCFYCGLKSSNEKRDKKKNGKYISDEIIKYNGIDRIDNTKGYTKDNIVACCKHCNYAKRSMTTKEFLSFVKRIYEKNFKSRTK